MRNKLIEMFAWIYSLSSTLLFLKISLEGLFRQIHNISKCKKPKNIVQNKNNTDRFNNEN